MKKLLYLFITIIFILAGTAFAQVGSPVTINIGIGGGVSMPSGDFSNVSNTGYHGLAKARFGGVIPIDITGAVSYHHFADKVGSDATNITQFAAGIEYAIPAPEVKPYISLEAAFNSITSTAAGASSHSREGLNIGAGVQFMGFDGSLKYQMLNLVGKEDKPVNGINVTEPSSSQITLTVLYTIGL